MRVSRVIKGSILVFLMSVTSAMVVAETIPPDIQKKIAEYQSPIGGDYVIGVDDQVQVSVWRNPDLTVGVQVRPDGKISVPLIGDVLAAGLTPKQLSQVITARMSEYIRNPQVSIILTGLNSNEYASRVRITGAVQNAQSVKHRAGMTVFDLVVGAGGLNEFASANKAVLFRKQTDGSYKEIPLRLNDLLKKGKLEYNLELKAGDVITVPERLF